MGEVVDFKTREQLSDYSIGDYNIDEFTMTWENLGLSYHGTLQICLLYTSDAADE